MSTFFVTWNTNIVYRNVKPDRKEPLMTACTHAIDVFADNVSKFIDESRSFDTTDNLHKPEGWFESNLEIGPKNGNLHFHMSLTFNNRVSFDLTALKKYFTASISSFLPPKGGCHVNVRYIADPVKAQARYREKKGIDVISR